MGGRAPQVSLKSMNRAVLNSWEQVPTTAFLLQVILSYAFRVLI